MKSDSTTKLYHAQIFIPESLKKPVFEGELRYTRHAQHAAESDIYGEVALPRYFQAEGAKLIEVETELGVPVKQLWRQKLDDKRDLILVITSEGSVKTVWINLLSDNHRTLDRTKYQRKQHLK